MFRCAVSLMMDKFKFWQVYGTIVLIQIPLSASLYWIASSKAAYMIWISLIILCEASQITVLPTMSAIKYGARAP